jgi:RNA polymerase-binding transcription factor DksA
MSTKRTFGREQRRELERAIRSSLGRLERSMWSAQRRRVALRARSPAAGQSNVASTPAITLSAGTLERHQELVAAIRRLEAGAYGVCHTCGASIDYERLARSPETMHCAQCARE